MIRRALAAGTACFILSAPAAAEDLAPKLDTIFAAHANPSAPGCAVGVDSSEAAPIARAWGSANLEHNIPNTPATVFEAGSVAKQFTAAAILLLAEEHRLALSDDVRKYVPELPKYASPITIDQLLSHVSGLRDWGEVAGMAGWPRGTRAHTNADALAMIARQRSLNYPPGAEYSYTNSGYNLAAIIVQRVSGKSLAEFTHEKMFAPLGMKATSWRDEYERVVSGRATAYRRGGNAWQQEMPFEDAYGNGGLLTTVGDLLIWNRALSQNRLGRAVTEKLASPVTLTDGTKVTYARGLFVDNYRGTQEISHGGATGGYRAWLGRWPEKRLSIAVLCNAADANTTILARKVADAIAFGRQAEQNTGFTGGGDLAGLAGLWASETSGVPRSIASAGGTLVVDGGLKLNRIADRSFDSPGGGLLFLSDDRFRFTSPVGQVESYRRVSPWSPTPGELQPLVGTYESDEAEARYEAFIQGGALMLRNVSWPERLIPLKPSYRHTFQGNGLLFRFRRGKNNEVEALSVSSGRIRDLRFSRQLAGRIAPKR